MASVAAVWVDESGPGAAAAVDEPPVPEPLPPLLPDWPRWRLKNPMTSWSSRHRTSRPTSNSESTQASRHRYDYRSVRGRRAVGTWPRARQPGARPARQAEHPATPGSPNPRPVEPDPLAWVVPEAPYRTPSIMTYGVAEIESVGGVPATPNVTPSIIRDGVPGAGSVVEAPDVAIGVEPVDVLEVVPPAVATEALSVAGPPVTELAEPALEPPGRLSAPGPPRPPNRSRRCPRSH